MANLPNAYQLPFSSYDPHPDIPGAYNFTHAGTGQQILAAGPEAERMRTLIDRMPPPPDERLASNAPPLGQPDAGTNDWIRGQQDAAANAAIRDRLAPLAHDANQGPSVAPTTAKSLMDPNSMRPEPTPAAVPAAQPAPAAPPPGIPTTSLAPRGAGGGEAPVNPDTRINPQDYVHKVTTKSGFVPGSESVKTEGGIQDPEARKLMLRAYEDDAAAARDANEAQKTALTNQAIQLDNENKLATAEAEKAQSAVARRTAMQQEADTEYSRIMAQKQKELETASGRQVDESPFKGKPAAAIGAALAMGLGAFGASISHGPNYAMEIINKQIDNHIQSQRDEINRGINAKTNDIARIKDKYNVDSATAEKLLALDLGQKAQAMARKQAAMIGGQQAQVQLAAMDQKFAEQNLARMKDLQATIAGKVETTMDQKYRQGGTSYAVDSRLVATAKAEKTLGEMQGEKYKVEHEGSAPPKAAAAGPGKLSARMAMGQAINHSAIKDIDNYMKDDPGGYISPIGGEEGGSIASTKARDALANRATAIVGKIVQGSNNSISEGELEAFKHKLQSPYENVRKGAAEELKRALATTNAAYEEQRGNVMENQAPEPEGQQ